MRLIVALLTCLMLLTSVGLGSVARAADACCMGATSIGVTVMDQDGCGMTPANCDKDCRHHGACHGHQVAATADADVPARPDRALSTPASASMARLVPVDLEGSLRPPRA